MENIHLSAGSIHLLNDATIPFLARLKLCRLLWVSKDVSLPRKHQMLLNSLCGQISSHKLGEDEIKMALTSVIEFLNQKQLTDVIARGVGINIKPSLVQMLTDSVQNQTNTDILRKVINLGNILSSIGWVKCSLASHFNTFATYLSSWVEYAIRQMNANEDFQFLEEVLKHIRILLERRKTFLRSRASQKNALTPFCKLLLSPLLKLHFLCSKKGETDKTVQKTLLILIEKFITDILFSKENMHLYADLKSNSMEKEIGEANRRNKKMQRSRRLHLVLSALQEMTKENPLDDLSVSHCVNIFFRLFLLNAKVDANTKVDMLKELSNMSCKCQMKCGEGITTCKNWNVITLEGLLKTSVEFRLYQPAVNQVLCEDLLQWFKKLLVNFVNNYHASPEWVSCVVALTNTDKAVVEPLLKSVLLKCTSKDCSGSLSVTDIFSLVHCLVDTYVKIRQSVRLVNIILLVINASSSQDNLEKLSKDSLGKMIKEFGHYLGSKFTAELSPALVVEIWLTILENIHQKVDAVETLPPNNDAGLHLVLKFFGSISTQSPIFALWDHLIVRQDLDKCLKLMKTCDGLLQAAVGTQPKTTENYLTLAVIRTNIEYTLQKYIIAESENVKPGLQRALFQDDMSLNLHFETLDKEEVKYLKSSDAKYSFVNLMLLRMQSLTENLAIISTVCKCGSDTRNEIVQVEKKRQEELDHCTSQLLTLLQAVEVTTLDCEFVRLFQLLGKFFPIILKCNNMEIHEWIMDATVQVVFQSDKPAEVGQPMFELLARTCASDEYQSYLSLLSMKAFSKLSSVLPGEVKFDIQHVEEDLHKAMTQIFDKNLSKRFTMEEAKATFKAIEKYISFLGKCGFTCLDMDHAKPIFLHILFLLYTVSEILENSVLCDEGLNALNDLIFAFLRIADGKNIYILQQCQPVKIFVFISRIKTLTNFEVRKMLSALQHELVLACYRNDPRDAFHILKHERTIAKKHNPDNIGDMISSHAKALVKLVFVGLPGDAAALKKLNSACQKRKLRDDEQICKKLKLSSPFDNGVLKVSQSAILSDLKALYKVSCKRFGKTEVPTQSTYNMSSSCLEAFNLLISEGNADMKADTTTEEHLEVVLNSINVEEDKDVFLCKLRFAKCCLQCPIFSYEYKAKHLEKLVGHYDKLTLSDEGKTELENCLTHLVHRIPKGCFQKDVLDNILRCLRIGNNDAMTKCFIQFGVLLIVSGILEDLFQGEDGKVSKAYCCRFVKCFLEALHTLVVKMAQNLSSADALLIEIALEAIRSVLKVKWVKFQSTEICNTLSSLHRIPMKYIADLEGPVKFVGVFKSYSEVLHCILIMFDDVRHISALFIAAFRHLLKSAMHLGKQKKN